MDATVVRDRCEPEQVEDRETLHLLAGHSGKRDRDHRSKGTPKAGPILKQAAAGPLSSRHMAPGAFGRRIRAGKGGYAARKAVARKRAELYRKLSVKGSGHVERGIPGYQERMLESKRRPVAGMAEELGLELVPEKE